MKIVVWEAVRTEGHFVRFETNCPAWANGIFMHNSSVWAGRNFCFRTWRHYDECFQLRAIAGENMEIWYLVGTTRLERVPANLKRDRWKPLRALRQEMVRIFPTRAPCSGNIPSFEGRCAGTQICSFYAANVLKSLLALRKPSRQQGCLVPRSEISVMGRWENAAWMELLRSYSMNAGQIQCKCLPCWFTETSKWPSPGACLK